MTVVTVLILAGAAGSLFAAFKGWQAVARDPKLRSRERLRDLPGPVLVLLLVAAAAGAVGGVILAAEVQRGKDQRFDR